MPEFFVILIKINIALALFCLGYYMVLRKLTFYTLNRAYLVTAILFSSVYPFIDLSVFAQRHQEIVAPVQNVVIIWKEPAENFVKQAAYWNLLELLFWAGVAVFGLRLLFQLASLYRIYQRSESGEINGQKVRVVNNNISPFSFWQSIFINPDKLSPTDLHNIIEHEQVHVKEWHTLDVLLTEISVIFYWFNPGIWLMKKAVRENIEFITDRKILQKGLDSKAYQYSLLNITFNQPSPAITSNFNFSTLKKRIKMMNAKRSSKLSLTRYAFLVPAVVVSLLVVSLSKARAVKTSNAYKAIAATVKNINDVVVVLNNDTTPVTKTISGTLTVKKGSDGKTTKIITLNSADLNNLTVKIDSPATERHTVTITGKRPGEKDSVITISIAGKAMGNDYFSQFNSNGLTGFQLNADNINSNKDDQVKQANGLSTFKLMDLNYELMSKSGDAKPTTATSGSNNNNVVIYAAPKTTSNINKDNNVVISAGAKTIGTYSNNNDNVVITGGARTVTSNADKLQAVTVEGKRISTYDNFNGKISDLNALTDANYQPLFIVDGKEVNQKDLKNNHVFDGSVAILDTKAATSVYGTKGKNGAIIITTKPKK